MSSALRLLLDIIDDSDFLFFTHPDAKIKLLTLELKPPFQFSGAPFFLGFVLMAVSAYFVYYVFHRKK